MSQRPLIFVSSETVLRQDGTWWVEIWVDGKFHDQIGPFRTHAICREAHEDFTQNLRDCGAIDEAPGVN